MAFRRAILLAASLFAAALLAPQIVASAQDGETAGLKLVIPAVDPTKGRQLFVTKGCVYCHVVNGVGGKAAPSFDSEETQPSLDIADFSARMWRGARAMIELQEMDLGFQIQLTGEELAHIAGFAMDPVEQKKFNEDQVPELMREWYLDEVIKAQ